jgi:hypothetical protein
MAINTPTRTELIRRAILGVLAEQEESLNAGRAPSQVAVIVNFDEANDRPRRVIIRPETSFDLRPRTGRDPLRDV